MIGKIYKKGMRMYMDVEYKKAYTDVLYIIKSFDNRIKNKISKKFLEFLKNNCDKTYIPSNISLIKPETLSQETKNVLSLIYRSYLDDKKNDSNIVKKEYLSNTVNIDKKAEAKEIIPENKSIIVQTKSNSIFKKIYTYIKHIFKHGGNN